jgi:hypothetical protein
MSVPLDRLYHYLGDVVNHDLLIYRWLPHGSRKLEDLDQLMNYPESKWYHNPIVIFHDQEPLNYTFYSSEQITACAKTLFLRGNSQPMLTDSVMDYLSRQHLRGAIGLSVNNYDLTILAHSEQYSVAVDLFEQAGFVPVYYWSHAVIAQDWFRYAEHDLKLAFDPTKIQQDFLIYNRAWAGTREYRLCFAEQLIEHNLVRNCNISFNPEDGKHYSTHQFVNPNFQITNYNLHNELRPNTHEATASADYCSDDYATAGIEVVLETLFDDSRWHLTEKTLRPIACGQPFLLMATAGSLQYLQQYGFETFGELIDETYDQIVNPRQRLQAVIAEMARIAALPQESKTQLFAAMNTIALRNQQRFFNGLHDQVINEYKNNMYQAMHTMQQHRTGRHWAQIKELLHNQ